MRNVTVALGCIAQDFTVLGEGSDNAALSEGVARASFDYSMARSVWSDASSLTSNLSIPQHFHQIYIVTKTWQGVNITVFSWGVAGALVPETGRSLFWNGIRYSLRQGTKSRS